VAVPINSVAKRRDVLVDRHSPRLSVLRVCRVNLGTVVRPPRAPDTLSKPDRLPGSLVERKSQQTRARLDDELKPSSVAALPSLHFRPRRYKPHGIGYWSGHIPFACDLIATLRPSLFVELGTHTAESFFAFCQAIVESGVQCRAVAVDTWRGDAHTGAYGDEVFREVDRYAREHYPSFTRLLRMTFDEANAKFDDGQIDLLHIDGMHTYEAVKHDFDTWWPKVKPGGVVVMHDSFDRHDGFGVWKLLEELRTDFPVSEFFHSHGLGIVVKPGGEDTDHVANAMVQADDDTLRNLRRYYQVCAGNLDNEYETAKRARPAEWNVTSQLFWRDATTGFSEESSIRLAHIVRAEGSGAILELPPAATSYAEFRLDLTLVFALLELRSIRALDKHGNELCRWTVPESLPVLQAGGLQAILSDDGTGALVLNPPIGSQIRLPVSQPALDALQGGGSFVIEMKALDANGFAQRIGAAHTATLVKHRQEQENLQMALQSAQDKLTERTRRVEELERSFVYRLARRFI